MPLFGPPNVNNLKVKSNVKGLIKALGYKKNKLVRCDAAQALGHIGDARAVEPLLVALKDSEWIVRYHAVEALGKIGDHHAVKPLIAALEDFDNNVRQAAAEALGHGSDARAVEPLTTALKDSEESVRQAAARALSKISGPLFAPTNLIQAEAFLTPDDCLDFITRSVIGNTGISNDVAVFVITARSSSILEYAYNYLQKVLPSCGFKNENIHLLELSDRDVAQQQTYELKEKIRATPSTKRVIIGKGFYQVCPDLLAVGRHSYKAMVILRELMPEDEMRRVFSIANNRGLADTFCNVFIDLETDACHLSIRDYKQLKELIEQRKPVGEMIMGTAKNMMHNKY